MPVRVTVVVSGLVLAGAILAGACEGPRPPEPTAPWQPRPLTDTVFQPTPARRAEGEYLVQGILQCPVCHSERDWSAPGAPPTRGRMLAGAVWWDTPWLVAPNLTPDAETGIGRWTDDMLARAIREGVSHDGRPLDPQMWSASFRALTDEELASVIVYLRSLAPIRNPLPPTTVPPDVAAKVERPPPFTDRPLEFVPAVARGGHLVALADCAGCHSSWHTPKNPGIFGGGNLITRAGGHAYSSNLTTDPSGIPYYDAALFREVMRTGHVKGRTLSAVMPWVIFGRLTDEDLDAIFAYLTAYRPAHHLVDNINAPAACALCGGTHPLGEYNRATAVNPVPYSIADWRDAAGAYRLDDTLTLVVEVRSGRLVLREGERGDPCDLVTEDGRRFVCDGGLDELEFVREGGVVTYLIDNRVDIARKVR